ncbi:RadC family protein [Thermosipho atlanticus]|uniref:DNA replication and repair protein RadC n=1 Tax=Thermosipho atlanticus DSM 15807 TaxID=1123380 RepID=A0A1M5RX38_9BACT|nr:DNA repair protein RadC [Thermosipho atlanticus]SHH30741.1 DNA replication and repair protein RadC [Thermosipho atlanticus DSM 15807]
MKPREKILNKGPESLTNGELLAILLRTGSKGQNVLETSKLLLENFDNSLVKISKATINELCKIKGLGHAKATTILAVMELAKRMLKEDRAGKHLNTPEKVYEYCLDMKHLEQEVVRVIFLNSKLHEISSKDITIGLVDTSLAHPREIFKEAIKNGAVYIILVHNHPSGGISPSPEDKQLTQKIKETGEIIGIKLLDHVIIGNGFYSFKHNKLI